MNLKFSCDRAVLSEGIGIASRVTMQRSSMPVLEGVLLSGMEGSVKLTGYNLESAMECLVEAHVKEKGDIVLPSSTFGDIVRKLPDGPVVIETDGLKVKITGGLSEFIITGYAAEDFPEVSMERAGSSFVIEQGMLKNMINRSVFAISTGGSNPIHMGCLFNIEGQDIEVVGVDGHRLALRREKLSEEVAEPFNFVITGKLLTEVARIIGDGEEKVTVWIGKRTALFETENFRLSTRTLEGEFLNYRTAIPKNFEITATVEAKLFADCLDRAALMINERQKSPVKITFEGNFARLVCSSPLGHVSDELPIQSTGGPLEIGFNNKFLQDALRYCGEDTLLFEMSTSLSPLVIRPTVGDSFTYLVLPVRLKATK